MSDSEPTKEPAPTSTRKTRKTVAPDMTQARSIAGRVVGAILALFAGVLALAALLIVLEANPENGLVEFVLDLANDIDLGVFSLDNPIKSFGDGLPDSGDLKKIALLNYGLGAVVYLIVSRVAERAIRP